MRLHLVLYAMILTACATARPIAGPDGTEHQLISCGPIEHCYEKAREVCGRYKIVQTGPSPC